MGAGRSATFPRVTELLSKEVEKIGQRGTARATGVAQQAIHRFLKGNSEPSQATLEKLAAYFGVSVAYLRGEVDAPAIVERCGDKVRVCGVFGREELIKALSGLGWNE